MGVRALRSFVLFCPCWVRLRQQSCICFTAKYVSQSFDILRQSRIPFPSQSHQTIKLSAEPSLPRSIAEMEEQKQQAQGKCTQTSPLPPSQPHLAGSRRCLTWQGEPLGAPRRAESGELGGRGSSHSSG